MQFRDIADDGGIHWFTTSDTATYDFEPDVGVTVTATTGTVIVAEGSDILPDRADVGITAVGVATMLGDPPDPIIRLTGFVDMPIVLSMAAVTAVINPTDPTDPGGGTGGGGVDYQTTKSLLYSELIPVDDGYRTFESVLLEMAKNLTPYASTTATKLDKDVHPFGTFFMPYPALENNLSDYLDRGHKMWDSAGTIYLYGSAFALQFVPNWIIVTNLASRVFKAGEQITLYLMKATPSGTTAVAAD